MKYYISIILLAVCLLSCNRDAEQTDELARMESLLEVQPDSALAVLKGMHPSDFTKAERAKHALLLSIALDKNFIDKTDFEVLQPAIDYYESHGTATDKLRTYYYQGRIFQNAGNDEAAMESFVKAISESDGTDDILTKARAYFAKSKIDYALYDWNGFIESNRHAAQLFKEAGKDNSYANCLNRIINGYTLNKQPEEALRYIEECKSIIHSMNPVNLSTFYTAWLTYLAYYGSEKEILGIIDEYTAAIPSQGVDWLTISNAYSKMGRFEEAGRAISNYNDVSTPEKRKRYYAVISSIYKHLGQYKESLEAYEEYITLRDSTDLVVIQQDTKFIEERHTLELQALQEKQSKDKILLWSALIMTVLLAVIVWIRLRLKTNKMEKLLAEQETEKYRQLYLQMEKEKEHLTELLSQGDELDPGTKAAISNRLQLLNQFFTAYITGSSELDKKATLEMEKLLSDKDRFMDSTRLAFTGSHPKFIQYLEEHGLTEWEIAYCCLYALGLKGKEVGAFINLKRHYNNSSSIREKLGLDEHGTNLGIYIRKLLASFNE